MAAIKEMSGVWAFYDSPGSYWVNPDFDREVRKLRDSVDVVTLGLSSRRVTSLANREAHALTLLKDNGDATVFFVFIDKRHLLAGERFLVSRAFRAMGKPVPLPPLKPSWVAEEEPEQDEVPELSLWPMQTLPRAVLVNAVSIILASVLLGVYLAVLFTDVLTEGERVATLSTTLTVAAIPTFFVGALAGLVYEALTLWEQVGEAAKRDAYKWYSRKHGGPPREFERDYFKRKKTVAICIAAMLTIIWGTTFYALLGVDLAKSHPAAQSPFFFGLGLGWAAAGLLFVFLIMKSWRDFVRYDEVDD